VTEDVFYYSLVGPRFFSVSSLLCVSAVIDLVRRPRQHGEGMSHVMGIIEIHIEIPLPGRRVHTQAKVLPPGTVVAVAPPSFYSQIAD